MFQNASFRVTFNTLVLYVKLLVSTILALINIPLLLRAIGKEDYGIFSVVGGVIALLIFLNETMTSATNRFLGVTEGKIDNRKERQNVFLHCLCIHTAIALILLLGFEFIAVFLWDSLLNISNVRCFAAKVVFQTMIVTTILTVVTVPYYGIIIIKEHMVFIACVAMAVSFAKLAITFILFKVDSDRLIIYSLLLMFAHIIERGTFVCYAHHITAIKYEKINLDHSLLKSMMSFFGWSMSINFSLPAVINGTSVLLNRFFGVLVNAAEGIAVQIAGQLTGVCGGLLNAVTPIIMKKQGGDQTKRALAIALTSCRMSVYLLMMVGIIVFIEMPFLLNFWLKEVPAYAVIFCRLILIRILIEQSTLPLATLMNANGNIMIMQLSSSIIYLSTLGIEYIILKHGGAPYSVYFCSIAMMIAVGIIRFLCVKKYYKLRGRDFVCDNILREIGVLCCGVIAAKLACSFLPSSLWRCVLCFLVTCIVLGGSILWFGITREERDILLSIYNQIRKYIPFFKKDKMAL